MKYIITMKKTVLFFTLVLLGFSGFAIAQNTEHEHTEKCATHTFMLEEQQKNPELKVKYESFNQELVKYLEQNKGNVTKSGNKRIIPVVVHVLHDGGNENISKAQIEDQIRILNDDFNFNSANKNLTPDPFKPLVADCEIEFRLANKDPLGNCTDGIVRVFTNKTNGATNGNGAKGVSYWNAYSYLNIWVVKTIGIQNPDGFVLGYAQFPEQGLTQTDGIVVIHNYFGSIGTANGRRGSTTTHEIGHWLGLRHTWGDAVCGSDFVEDTPTAQGPNFGICWNNFPHKVGVCEPDSINPHGEMFMNYMDYVDDNCMSMFSLGQKEVMDFVLHGPNGNNGFRSFMHSEANLMATGVSDNYTQVPCAPIAEFNQTRSMICAGNNVSYSDNSFNGSVTSREWSFQGGNPATSSAATVLVSYDTPGKYSTTLTTSNNLGTSTITKDEAIIVSSTTASFSGNPQESFTDRSAFNENWIINNPDNSPNKWEWVEAGYYDIASVRMINMGNIFGQNDELISPAYDISGFSSPVTLSFKLAGAERGFDPDDRLVIQVSNNCGQTWTTRGTVQGWALNTAGQHTSFFTPINPNQWKDFFFTLPATNNSNLRIKFDYIRGRTPFNNVYIDNINIGTALNTLNIGDLIGLTIFPNPTNDITQITFSLETPKQIAMSLYDITGREVAQIYSGMSGVGEQNMQLNMSAYNSGMYFLRMVVDGEVVSKKIIKK
jgi:PKD repeat protein